MERNHIIGFLLIFATLFVWSYLNKPDAAELERRKQLQDSIANLEAAAIDTLNTEAVSTDIIRQEIKTTLPDSILQLQNAGLYGPFAPSSVGEEKEYTLENSKVKVTFSNKGGKITSVELKEHTKQIRERGKEMVEEQVVLLDDPRNKFEYLLPVASAPSGSVSTEDLYFDAKVKGEEIVFTAKTNVGGNFVQKYTLSEAYKIDYAIDYRGLERVFDAKSNSIELNWENYLHPYERNARFEQQYSAVYFKETEESVDDCGCMQDDKKVLDDNKVDWVSHSNQYFNSTLITNTSPFESAVVESVGPSLGEDSDADHMELLTSVMQIPLDRGAGNYEMSMYVGPNDYYALSDFNVSLEYIIPFGNSIFGSINRWVIRPVFDFLSKYIGSLGIVIILVIFVIKMLLYPLMYKMLHSQALMGALKPELAHLNEKYKDKPQEKQMETMKIYREYGVSPLGGCLPMLIQMPIWYALFRFFPASISFRQEAFLWAHDLSSYDDFFHLPFHIPFVGDHLSLFTILYSISMLAYTYYNTKHMDMSANPAMKYMQYLMPVMFFGFFNTYASGLTCYMFFSNLINISQTVLTKKFVFKDEKLKEELRAKKAKPKKKGGFQQRMEEALKQQQDIKAKKQKK
ncbi:MAG: membrane protein insertase YidC [Saprospiraceae bacterium]|nr:membrane protein insertase YidC [Saprospiraceae bacterium]